MRVEGESSTPTLRPLFKEQMARHNGRRQATTARSRWQKLTVANGQVGSGDPTGRSTPLWAHWLRARVQVLPNDSFFNALVPSSNLLRKMFKFIFLGFSCSEIFLDFCEK